MKLALNIRTKLLLMLLALTLLPLLLTNWRNQQILAYLGNGLTARTTAALSESARQLLGQMSLDYAALLKRQREIVELVLLAQAREAQALLDAPAPPPRKVLSADAITASDAADLSTAQADIYYRLDATGQAHPLPVSFSRPACRMAGNTDLDPDNADLARLATMEDYYRTSHLRHADLLYWQYTALESGLHCVYPGHGGYPADYDPRQRPWYRQQKARQQLLWTPPTIDASSQRITLTASMPLYREDGQFAGVTGIDVPITDIFSHLRLPAAWRDQAKVFLVSPAPSPGSQRITARIIAKQSYRRSARNWQSEPAQELLGSSDGHEFSLLLTDLAHRRAGIRQLPYQGVDSLWAYRPFDVGDSYMVFIVPHAQVISAAHEARDYGLQQTRRQLRANIPIFLVTVLAVVLMAWFIARSITRPVQQLAGAARRIASGQLDTRVTIHCTGDELEQLGTDFNAMLPQLQDRISMLESLSLAREVQQKLLPQSAPMLPGLDIAGLSRYCDQTGGDYYDFIRNPDWPDAQLLLAIGDVSGHGISSALMMASVRALLRSYSGQGLAPAEILSRINCNLCRDSHAGQFMTLFLLFIAADRQQLCWASAGHDAALVYHADEDAFEQLEGTDIPLGVEPEWQYSEADCRHWRGGDLILLGTDGIWEARNPDGEQFGKQRLAALLRQHAGLGAEDLCLRMVTAANEFRGGLPQADDMTIVILKVLA